MEQADIGALVKQSTARSLNNVGSRAGSIPAIVNLFCKVIVC